MRSQPKIFNPAIQPALVSLGRKTPAKPTPPAEDIQLERPVPAWRTSCEAFLDLAFHTSEITRAIHRELYADESLRNVPRSFEIAYYSALEDLSTLLDRDPDLAPGEAASSLQFILADSQRSWCDMCVHWPGTISGHSLAWADGWDLGYAAAISLLQDWIAEQPRK